MKQELYREFCRIAYDEAGMYLGADKVTLVESRVAKRLRALGIETEEDYLEFLHSDSTGREILCFLDVITTNYTRFMREPEHFDYLRNVMRNELIRGRKTLRVWCAASSSGEEPYSLGIVLSEMFEGTGVDFRILATDISTRVLKVALAGEYDEDALEELSEAQRKRFFRKTKDGRFAVKEDLKRRVVFQRLNLSKPPFPMSGPLNFVFCRNVLMYFDEAGRSGVLKEIERLLAHGGVLFLGHSESLSGIDHGFSMIKPSIYRK